MTLEQEAANELRAVAGELTKIEVLREFSVDLPRSILLENRKDEVDRQLDGQIGKEDYALYAISFPEADQTNIYEAFRQARNAKLEGRAYSRLLPPPQAKIATKYAYVGSSEKPRSRILQHIGVGAARTYALHMRYWALGLGTPRIEFRLYDKACVSKQSLLLLEDHWANTLVPLFGRRGSL